MPNLKSTKETNYQFLVRTISELPRPFPNECVIWPFGRANNFGHGSVYFPGEKQPRLVHREAYRIVFGVYPNPCGRHTCDTAACFNPGHVIPGTYGDNNRDTVARGRSVEMYARVPKTWAKKESRFEYLIRTLEALPKPFPQHCVEWPFARLTRGYGFIHLPGDRENITLIHRFAYHWAHGCFPDPEGMHTCDNPPCFNPGHIVAGTRVDNMEDKTNKGRQSHGEGHYRSVLTEENVRAIRREYIHGQRGHGYISLAAKYGVGWQTIKSAVVGKSWKHIDKKDGR